MKVPHFLKRTKNHVLSKKIYWKINDKKIIMRNLWLKD